MSIFNLLRPKPIFVITIPSNSYTTPEYQQLVKHDLIKQMGDDYHIIVNFDSSIKQIETKILK
jgi:hypothetical protein